MEAVTFDVRPCVGCTMDDLVLDLFLVTYLPAAVDRSVIEENDRPRPEQMASLRLYDLAAGCPTNAAVLLFGRDSRRWIPGARVQFVRWAGTTMADDPIAEWSFSGDLVSMPRDLETFAALPAPPRPVPATALATLLATLRRAP